MSNPHTSTPGVRQTIISSIEAPRLRGVSTKHFIEFKKKRELYEKQIQEKNADPSTNIPLVSYKASIENTDLRLFIAAGWVEATSIENITELHTRQCVQDRVHRLLDGEHLHLINDAIKPLTMKMNIIESEDRVWTFHRDYLNLLEAAGYEELPSSKPHIAISHIMKRLKPTQLRRRMKGLAKWKKDEGFDRKDFNAFMREVAKQARKIEEDKMDVEGNWSDGSDSECEGTRKREKHRSLKPSASYASRATRPSPSSIKPPSQSQGKQERSNTLKRKRDDDLPPCLNLKCRAKGGRHYIQHCDLSDEPTKTKLREEYRATKKARIGKGRIATMTSSLSNAQHSALFSASFAEGRVCCKLLADQGADVNLLPETIADQILSMGKYKFRRLTKPRIYKTISGGICARCEKEVTLDVHLKIRHGSNLILRNVTWEIPDNNVRDAILGRHVLESIGCDNRSMLEAASKRHDGDINMEERLEADNDESDGNIAALYGDSLYHTGMDEEDGLEKIEDQSEFGDNTNQEITNALDQRTKEAERAGLSPQGIIRLKNILKENSKAFRLRLGSGGPAKVTPMKISIIEGKRPIRVKVRRYPSEQRVFLNEYISNLVEYGFIKADSTASWQAAPHLVPKGKDKWRITIDLRPINAATKTEVWPMPNLESELSDFSGSSHFASLDFCSAYWQIPLEAKSSDACGIIAPQGSFVSTRVLHGLKNATAYFQATIPPLFGKVQEHIKSWLDDFTLHAKTEVRLLDSLEKFLKICIKFNLILSAKKCAFYARSVKWCGRIIDQHGYRLDPKNVEALRNMQLPITADELCQFVHCCRWMSTVIPNFQQRCEPLTEALEAAYTLTGKRKKSALKNVALSKVSWGATHEVAFKDLQNALKNAVKLAFPREGKATCVFTDASDKFWAAIVSQVDLGQLGMDTSKQDHEPLAFIGGQFSGAQMNWTTYEKEAFAIVKVFDKLDFVLWGRNKVHVFTDHRNLLFVFAPLALRPNAPRYVLSKVHRWAIHLSRFDFNIEHIDGVKNVFADLLTRWSKGHRQGKATCGNVMALYKCIVPPATDAAWPDTEEVVKAQAMIKTHVGQRDKDGIWRNKGKITIPEEATELKLNILVAAHCGSSGHRGAGATDKKVRTEFRWSTLTQDVKEFTQGCVHCLISRSGERVPRPLGTALHAQKPNEVVHMDFLFMGPSTKDNLKYLLIMKDDLTSFTWLFASAAPDAETATNAISKWISTFGSMDWLVSDQGSHFTASIVKHLAEEARIRQHFTTAYCPWANGSVERLCKEVLRTAKALLSEWQMPPTQWTCIVNCIQMIINQSPLERLGQDQDASSWRSPMQLFTGRKPQPMMIRPGPISQMSEHDPIDAARAREIARIPLLHAALNDIHRIVADEKKKRRTQAQRKHNALTRVTPVNFIVGDFVMVRSMNGKRHKLSSKWLGPMRVIATHSNLVYEVENLSHTRKQTTHAQRMLHYPAATAGEDVSKELMEHAAFTEHAQFLVEKLVDVREKEGVFEVLVRWKGFENLDDATWEPLETIREDVPSLLWDLLHAGGKRRLKEKILNLL